MKINYSIKKIKIKKGSKILEEELNSGKLFIFDKDTMDEYLDESGLGDWDGDRKIEFIEIIDNKQFGFISGTRELYVNLASLQKYRDENKV